MHTPESGDGLFQDLSIYEKEARVGQKHSPCPSGRKKTHTTKRQHSTRRSSWKKSGKGDYLQDSQGDDDLPVASFLSYIEIKEGKHLLSWGFMQVLKSQAVSEGFFFCLLCDCYFSS